MIRLSEVRSFRGYVRFVTSFVLIFGLPWVGAVIMAFATVEWLRVGRAGFAFGAGFLFAAAVVSEIARRVTVEPAPRGAVLMAAVFLYNASVLMEILHGFSSATLPMRPVLLVILIGGFACNAMCYKVLGRYREHLQL